MPLTSSASRPPPRTGSDRTRYNDSLTTESLRKEAILKTGALQNAILNSANFSSIATDEHGIIQIFNVGAERMFGYTSEEVVDRLTPADLSDAAELVVRAETLSREAGATIAPGFEALAFKASRGIEDIYGLTYIRKDGSRFPALVSVSALRDGDGAIIGYLVIGTDDTTRRQVEEKLRWTEESFRLMVDSVADCAIVMLDPEGHVVSWNTGAERIQGFSATEIVGEHFGRFYPVVAVDGGMPQRDLAQALESGRYQSAGWRVRKDGSLFWADVVFTAIRTPAGTLRGYAKLTRDLTERNNVEETLTNARATAEKANLAKSDFLSSMSHELRSPLNAILGFAQLMESDLPPPSVAQKESVDQILRAGWYLLDLINEILDLAVIESGKLSMSVEPVSLVEVILECRAMIEPLAQQRGIAMTFPRFAEPFFVRADRTRLKQVIINLLSNAIKYNRLGGSVDVDCSATALEGHVRITVADSGAGLPPEKVAQLFQPFNRLGQEGNSEEGTGIGLVVSKRLVELMHGAISVESEVGKGSVFNVDLISTAPLVLPPLASSVAVAAAALRADEAVRTLLYVEDNPANLKLVERLIARRPDLRLLSAIDGNTGVDLARTFQPEVILMDINLPGISGIEALEILRLDPLTAHIPVVALSANAIPRDIQKGLDAGFFDYLTKPIKVAEFLETLNLALEAAATRNAGNA